MLTSISNCQCPTVCAFHVAKSTSTLDLNENAAPTHWSRRFEHDLEKRQMLRRLDMQVYPDEILRNAQGLIEQHVLALSDRSLA